MIELEIRHVKAGQIKMEESAMKKEIVFIDEDTLTPEEWEELTDEQAEE